MGAELLLDTGALISLLDRSQRHHEDCRRFFESWDHSVVSTEPVLTEATHLLGRIRGAKELCLDFFLSGGARLVPTTVSALRRARELMVPYQDLPMDYADALPGGSGRGAPYRPGFHDRLDRFLHLSHQRPPALPYRAGAPARKAWRLSDR